MRGWKAALALLLSMVLQAGSALAEVTLFIGGQTVSAAQADALAHVLEEELAEAVVVFMQEEDDGFSQRMMDGNPPHFAVLRSGEARLWAGEGLLTALDGCAGEAGDVAQEVIDACVTDEQLYAVPIAARRYAMAVRPAWLEKIGMAYLLDERMHPAWYPTQVLQALDELALKCDAGLEIWPPEEEDTLCYEALLQGVCGSWYDEEATNAADADPKEMEAGFVWMEEMMNAGLIGAAPSRDAALRRFLSGETAIFIDWTPEDSIRYAKEIETGEIRLLPYPSATGVPVIAAEVVCFLAPVPDVDAEVRRARHAAALLAPGGLGQLALGEQLSGADGMEWLTSVNTLDHGATLRALFADALCAMASEELTAREAAARIARAMAVIAR